MVFFAIIRLNYNAISVTCYLFLEEKEDLFRNILKRKVISM